MDRFEAMRTLLAAVDGGSLSAASRALSTPLPTVTRRISDLETRLGVRFLVRHRRRLILTEAGEVFVAAARRILDALSEAERTAGGEYREPRGNLRVTAPIMFGKLHVAPIVHDFLAAYPPVTVSLILTDQIIDLDEAHIDVAIRIGPLPDSRLIARQAGKVRWTVCASPDYLRRRGEPTAPDGLPEHDCIAFEGLQRRRTWSFGEGPSETRVTIAPRFSVNTADAVVEAAAAGLGIARLMSYQVAEAIVEGRLKPLFPDQPVRPAPVSLVYPAEPVQPLKRRAFLDYVGPRLNRVLAQIEDAFR
ncbi:MAG: LysR family transcriptional regulator [Phenylobacterium sp.]|nr:LysR family transcriptional regulator [Phenylobacterium sp.]